MLDPGTSDGQIGARLRRDVGHARMRAAWEAPDSFVPARWAGYLEKAARDGDVTAYRHY